MKLASPLLAVTVAIASMGFAVDAKADTVKARCDVYPKGSDRASWYGLCTFSQQQGFIDIQLQNGKRYDLRPVGNQADNYVTQNGQKAYREAGLGDKGQIYRLANESIYVYWDPSPFDKPASNPATSRSSTSGSVRLGTLRSDSPNAKINLRSGPTINCGCSTNCRPHSWHLNRCLPLWIRPFLTVWEDAQVGQAGMFREHQQEALLPYHYILGTTQSFSGGNVPGAIIGIIISGLILLPISKIGLLQAIAH